MDKISSEKRSKIMAAIHSKDTKPELIVRRYLHACGFRYRLHHKRLPGHPDIVLRKYRTCIFINGCFWHGHDCHNFRPPLTHTEFWTEKIARNKARDKAQQQELAKMGWHCVTIWECELETGIYTQPHLPERPHPVLSQVGRTGIRYCRGRFAYIISKKPVLLLFNISSTDFRFQ